MARDKQQEDRSSNKKGKPAETGSRGPQTPEGGKFKMKKKKPETIPGQNKETGELSKN
jgi:hypothetical protein